jgi:predicted nuclease with TOPRIM domain
MFDINNKIGGLLANAENLTYKQEQIREHAKQRVIDISQEIIDKFNELTQENENLKDENRSLEQQNESLKTRLYNTNDNWEW